MEYKRVKLSELKEIKALINEPLIRINTPIFISHMTLPLFFLFAFVWMTVSITTTAYIVPLIIMFAFLLYRIWQLFEPINIIKINKPDKCFFVIPINLFKRIIIKKYTIPFTDIIKFTTAEGPEFMLEKTRYIISANLKDSSTIPCFQTTNKAISNEILEFLNRILRSI